METEIILYTCKGKGGEYLYLGSAIGAGKSRDYGDIVLYQDTTTGQIFYRKPENFDNRMEKL